MNRATATATGAGAGSTVWGATVSIAGDPVSTASSSSEPPQRSRVTGQRSSTRSPTLTQLATNGWSRIAAAWASTSLPTSVPLAITSSGASDSIAAASDCPHVSGP